MSDLLDELEDELDEYLANEAHLDYLLSTLFTERCHALDEAMANGGLAAADAAELVGLPFPVFRYLFACTLATMVSEEADTSLDPGEIARSRGAANCTGGRDETPALGHQSHPGADAASIPAERETRRAHERREAPGPDDGAASQPWPAEMARLSRRRMH